MILSLKAGKITILFKELKSDKNIQNLEAEKSAVL